MLSLVTIACLEDNYAYLLHDDVLHKTALIDAPEATPIREGLDKRGWKLDEIWLTHHHWDHVEGVEELRSATGAQVIGAKADAHRLPKLDCAYEEGDSFEFAGHRVEVLDVSGHTQNHIAFYVKAAQAAFTGDSLMAMGCGRLFEGSAAQMYKSLDRLAQLPHDTLVCSGHEYTASNAAFAMTIEPENQALRDRVDMIQKARDAGLATVPSLLSDELATNPFLRSHVPSLKEKIGLQNATAVDVFTKIRELKDNY